MSSLVPIVIEKEPNGMERSYDIYSRLLKDYIVFVTGPIDEGVANTFIAQLLFLESNDPTRDISVYINSPGGYISAGMAMFDTMQHVKNDIATINVGMAASFGAVLLVGGTKGKRYALSHAETMIHQPLISGGVGGQASDIEITAKQIVKSRDILADIFAKRTGKKKEQVMTDMDRDKWLDSKEALEYGIIDKIMDPKKK